MKYVKSSVIFIAVMLFVGFLTNTIYAQTSSGNGFKISPVKSELTINKGTSKDVSINVENPTDSPIIAKPIVNNFLASDTENGEARIILDAKVQTPKNDFIKLVGKIEELNLGPREKRDITVKITVADNANSGGYYGTVRFVPASINNSGNVSLTASVGTIILIRVPGDLIEKVDLLKLGAGQNGKFKNFIASGNVDVLTRLQNNGDIHTQPFGKVIVKNMFGKKIQEFELNKDRANILPGSIRKFSNTIDKKSGWFGRYTIEANLGYSQDGGDVISAKAVFWYIPAIILYTILTIIILIVLYILLSKRFMPSKNKK